MINCYPKFLFFFLPKMRGRQKSRAARSKRRGEKTLEMRALSVSIRKKEGEGGRRKKKRREEKKSILSLSPNGKGNTSVPSSSLPSEKKGRKGRKKKKKGKRERSSNR